MADDDDWETDADYQNDLTEAEQRAFGNREQMVRYNEVMEKSGGSIPGEAKAGVTLAAPVSSQPPSEPQSNSALPAHSSTVCPGQ